MSIPGNWTLNRSIQNAAALCASKGGGFGEEVGVTDQEEAPLERGIFRRYYILRHREMRITKIR
jgi:hypothetical protein